jgi:hypothetical protein
MRETASTCTLAGERRVKGKQKAPRPDGPSAFIGATDVPWPDQRAGHITASRPELPAGAVAAAAAAAAATCAATDLLVTLAAVNGLIAAGLERDACLAAAG